MKKFITRVLLLPPICWFIPEHHRQMIALQEFKRRLDNDPDLLERVKKQLLDEKHPPCLAESERLMARNRNQEALKRIMGK